MGACRLNHLWWEDEMDELILIWPNMRLIMSGRGITLSLNHLVLVWVHYCLPDKAMDMPRYEMSGLASQFCPGWLFFSKMGFVGKGGKEPMVYVSREGCVLVKTNLSLMKDTECRLSDFSMGRQGKHQFCSVNKSNMLEVVRDGARYVKLSDGYHAVTKQLPKQIQDGSVWLLNYLTDWDGLWDWNCQVVKQRYEKTWDFPINDIDRSKYLKNKIETFADFPTKDIDKNKNGESCLYDLYALSNHYSGGHYTAHAKLIDDYKWYHFDDSHAHP
ncbi:hypothetical protein DY000_02038650 [Brassica cretica]|uniref:Peptidase C19 ubiquitin carboxyl-terminal hydrolase domain-containing protein n=1 Tax=Brassica cretica TaxID=69181 RepID=A0ABQ7BQ60_BRACR|nr:hypothetical protein DY000_02038650 [Brassica cretica]